MTINGHGKLLGWSSNCLQKEHVEKVMEVNNGVFCFMHKVKIPGKILWQKWKKNPDYYSLQITKTLLLDTKKEKISISVYLLHLQSENM